MAEVSNCSIEGDRRKEQQVFNISLVKRMQPHHGELARYFYFNSVI